jgi:hypothetical protein
MPSRSLSPRVGVAGFRVGPALAPANDPGTLGRYRKTPRSTSNLSHFGSSFVVHHSGSDEFRWGVTDRGPSVLAGPGDEPPGGRGDGLPTSGSSARCRRKPGPVGAGSAVLPSEPTRRATSARSTRAAGASPDHRSQPAIDIVDTTGWSTTIRCDSSPHPRRSVSGLAKGRRCSAKPSPVRHPPPPPRRVRRRPRHPGPPGGGDAVDVGPVGR